MNACCSRAAGSACTLAAALLVSWPLQVFANDDALRQQLDQKIRLTANLISDSPSAQRIGASGNAEAVGTRTTRAVVESIFVVIVLDAFFAVFFSALGYN